MKEAVHFDELRHWQETDVNKRPLIDFCYPVTHLTFWEISRIKFILSS